MLLACFVFYFACFGVQGESANPPIKSASVEGKASDGVVSVQPADDTPASICSLMPHRARYEISLEKPSNISPESNLSQLTGHAIVEVKTLPGDGYIRNVTFVMHAYSDDQPMQTIIRSFATVESEDGQNLTVRVRTSNELGEEVLLKGEGFSPNQLKGFIRTDVDTERDESDAENNYDLNTVESIRMDLPVGTIFPMRFLCHIMGMISGNVSQESSTITLYDPYWSGVYDVDLSVVPSKTNTCFKLDDVVSDQAKKQLEGQPVRSVVCGFYPAGVKEDKVGNPDGPMHQMRVSLIPCGIATEFVMEDPTIGEPIKLVLSHVDLLA